MALALKVYADSPVIDRAKSDPPEDPSVRYVCQRCLPAAAGDGSRKLLVAKRCPIHGAAWHRRTAWTADGWLDNRADSIFAIGG